MLPRWLLRVQAPGALALGVLLVLLGVDVGCWHRGCRGAPVDAVDQGDLSEGTAARGVLTSTERHQYEVELEPGQALRLVVRQQGLDVVARVRRPDGTILGEVDSPNGAFEQEILDVVARDAGEHVVEVEPFLGAGTGYYELTWSRGPASAQGRRRARASRRFSEGRRYANEPDLAEKTKRAFEEAASTWEQGGDDYQASLARVRIARLLRDRDDVEGAMAELGTALELAEAAGDPCRQAMLINEIGVTFRHLGRLDRAQACYEQARRLAQMVGFRPAEALAERNLAIAREIGGDYIGALRAADRARRFYAELGQLRHLAETDLIKVEILILLGRLDEAEDVAVPARAVFEQQSDLGGVVRAGQQLGWIRHRQARESEASELLEQALEIAEKLPPSRSDLVAGTLDRLGSVERSLGQWESARSRYETARAISLGRGDRISAAYTDVNRCELQLDMGQSGQALDLCEAALGTLDSFDEHNGSAHALFLMARAEAGLGRLESALSYARASVAEAERARAQAGGQIMRTSFLATRYGRCELLVDLLMRLEERSPGQGRAAEALAASERCRARTLLEGMERERPARGRGPAASSVVAAARGLGVIEARRLNLQQQGASQAELAAVELEVRQALLRLDEASADADRPGGPGGSSVGIPPLEHVQQKLLDPRSLLLVYALGPDRSYLWAVDRESFESFTLPPRETLEGQARALAEVLQAGPAVEQRLQLEQLAAALAESTLGPVADRLAGRRLLLVTDGALQLVPFGVLPEPAAASKQTSAPARQGVPLLAGHEIITLPSVRALDVLRRVSQHQPMSSNQVVVVCDPVYSADDQRVIDRPGSRDPEQDAGSGDVSEDPAGDALGAGMVAGLQLPRLEHSADEAAAIVGLLPQGQARRLCGFDATREAVLDPALGRARMLHLAVHGLVDPQYPSLSGLVLSTVDRGGRPRPSVVHAFELSRLDLPVDLVVLSACRTGTGKQELGEGLMGLTRAFLEAGAAGAIVALWDVDDRAGSRLMTGLYRRMLADGLSPADALRESQLELQASADLSHPYYWAGFVYCGKATG